MHLNSAGMPHSCSSLAIGVSLLTPPTSDRLVIWQNSVGSSSISFFFFQKGPFTTRVFPLTWRKAWMAVSSRGRKMLQKKTVNQPNRTVGMQTDAALWDYVDC